MEGEADELAMLVMTEISGLVELELAVIDMAVVDIARQRRPSV